MSPISSLRDRKAGVAISSNLTKEIATTFSRKSRGNSYFNALDGLRAISILLVVISHAGMGLEKIFAGTLGVLIFFCISGFLITNQIIKEIKATGKLAIGKFYLRRLLRLQPTLLFYLIIFVPILLYWGVNISLIHIMSAILYLVNYYHIFIGYPQYNPMPIMWSLAVEEHYYLIFPFVMLAFKNNLKKSLPYLIVAVVVALFWRIIISSNCGDYPSCQLRIQATDTIFDCIIYGAIIAIILHYYNDWAQKFIIGNQPFLLAIFAIILSLSIRGDEFKETIRYSLESISVAIIIANLVTQNEQSERSNLIEFCSKILSLPAIRFIGKISYALYLFHFGCLITIEKLHNTSHLQGLSDFILYISTSFFMAILAYFLIEKPMLKIRSRKSLH